jgi:uncharacterized protein YjbI with pentapeptide repeats
VAAHETLAALALDGNDWNEYVVKSSHPIDLAHADLSNRDLRGRLFRNCDLVAASFECANIDGCVFEQCDLTAADLRDVSCVGANWAGVKLVRASLDRAVFRKCVFRDVVLEELEAEELFLGDCQLSDCTIAAITLRESQFVDIRVVESRVRAVSGSKATLRDVYFGDSTITDLELEESVAELCWFERCAVERWRASTGRVSKCRFRGCDLTSFEFGENVAADLDLSESVIDATDLRCLDLPTAVLLNSAVKRCSWPPQRGRVSWFGRYQPSTNLMRQPVQDLSGVAPLVRREIADAQFLVARNAHAGRFWQRGALRLWGALAGYGQSVTRLGLWSAVAVFVDVAIALAWRSFGESGHVPHHDMWNLIRVLAAAFVGLDTTSAPHSPQSETTLIVAARIEGFVVLGLLIGVASNKLAKLSSE